MLLRQRSTLWDLSRAMTEMRRRPEPGRMWTDVKGRRMRAAPLRIRADVRAEARTVFFSRNYKHGGKMEEKGHFLLDLVVM